VWRLNKIEITVTLVANSFIPPTFLQTKEADKYVCARYSGKAAGSYV